MAFRFCSARAALVAASGSGGFLRSTTRGGDIGGGVPPSCAASDLGQRASRTIRADRSSWRLKPNMRPPQDIAQDVIREVGCWGGASRTGSLPWLATHTADESKSSTGSPAFDAYVRTISEIPSLVIDDHGCYFLRGKRNLFVSSHFDDAALAGDNLIETPSALELD